MAVDSHPSPYFVVTLVAYLAHWTIVNPPPNIHNDDASHCRLYFYKTCMMYPLSLPTREKNSHNDTCTFDPILPFALCSIALLRSRILSFRFRY